MARKGYLMSKKTSLVVILIYIISLSLLIFVKACSAEFIVSAVVLNTVLFIAALQDIRTMTVSIKLITLLLIFYIIITVSGFNIVSLSQSLLGGAISCLLLLSIYFISKRQLGEGDIMLLVACSLFLGVYGFIRIIVFSLLMAAIFSIGLLIIHKAGKKTEISFVPFIMVGTVITILLW